LATAVDRRARTTLRSTRAVVHFHVGDNDDRTGAAGKTRSTDVSLAEEVPPDDDDVRQAAAGAVGDDVPPDDDDVRDAAMAEAGASSHTVRDGNVWIIF
jgi:hypothetical protein